MTDNTKVFNMDCMEAMRNTTDKYYDLAVVDPPYGINAGKMTMGSGKHKFAKGKDWDSSTPNEVYFNELFRVSKNQIIWGGNYFTEYLKPTPHWIVWDKKNPNLSFAEGELAWVADGKNLRIFQYYSAMVENGGKIHPTQKPVKLYEWLLHHYAKPTDKILDTHLGSQSSRIAAYKGGYDFTGYEIDADYFNDGNKRFNQFKSQTTIQFT